MYYPDMPEWYEENHEELRSGWPVLSSDSNREPPEYKTEVLPVDSSHSVMSFSHCSSFHCSNGERRERGKCTKGIKGRNIGRTKHEGPKNKPNKKPA
jgi:hypothetical protein